MNNIVYPHATKSGDINRDIETLKNWFDSDLKYQMWSLGITSQQNAASMNIEKEHREKVPDAIPTAD